MTGLQRRNFLGLSLLAVPFKWATLVTAFVIIFVMAINSDLPIANAKMTPHRLKILPFGDSLTAGGYNLNRNEWHVDGGYRRILFDQLKLNGINFEFVGAFENGPSTLPDRHHEGHSGWRADQLLAISGEIFSRFKPDIVLLLIGTNDVVQGRDVDLAVEDTIKVIEKFLASSYDQKLFVSNLIPTNNFGLNLRIKKFNQLLKKAFEVRLKNSGRVYFVDMHQQSKISNESGDLTDGVHPTPLGYDKMGLVWTKNLLSKVRVYRNQF